MCISAPMKMIVAGAIRYIITHILLSCASRTRWMNLTHTEHDSTRAPLRYHTNALSRTNPVRPATVLILSGIPTGCDVNEHSVSQFVRTLTLPTLCSRRHQQF